MESKKAESIPAIDLEQLVADADMGGRRPIGFAARLLTAIAIAWSLFQLWYASPLPFLLGWIADVAGIEIAIALLLVEPLALLALARRRDTMARCDASSPR